MRLNYTTKKLYREEDTDFRETRFLPEVKDFDLGMILYDDKVALISLQKPYSSILIKNEIIYALVKFIFNSLWKELEGKNLP